MLSQMKTKRICMYEATPQTGTLGRDNEASGGWAGPGTGGIWDKLSLLTWASSARSSPAAFRI